MSLSSVLTFLVQIGALLFAVSIHESAHGWMAEKFGDPTARMQGRITLNPIAHIDPVGSVIFPIILAIMKAPVFGWAKPVMVNTNNLRDPKRANIFISAAGPGSNILAACAGIALFLVFKSFGLVNLAGLVSSDGPGLLTMLLFYLIIINIYLAIFNLIPVPPLDGSGILEGLLSGEALFHYRKLRPYGFIILILVIYTGVLSYIANPILIFVIKLLR